MIEANKKAFSNLINQFTESYDKVVPDATRYIATVEEEKEWLKHLIIKDSLSVTPQIRLALIQFDNQAYISLIGADIDTTSLDLSILNLESLNAGIITVLLSKEHLKLNRSKDLLHFYNEILFQHEDSSYSGHDFEDILSFVEPILLFKLPTDTVLKDHILARIAVYLFSKDGKNLVLDFTDDVTTFTADLAILGSDSISYKLILTYLFSTTYKHAFLELYRLIERLFPIAYMKQFHQISNSKLDFLEFITTLENVTNWRPKEDEAIQKIFEATHSHTTNHFENFINTLVEKPTLPTYFYKLRNSIVHFRANHLEYNLSTTQWNLLIYATLWLIDEQYTKNQHILS